MVWWMWLRKRRWSLELKCRSSAGIIDTQSATCSRPNQVSASEGPSHLRRGISKLDDFQEGAAAGGAEAGGTGLQGEPGTKVPPGRSGLEAWAGRGPKA